MKISHGTELLKLVLAYISVIYKKIYSILKHLKLNKKNNNQTFVKKSVNLPPPPFPLLHDKWIVVKTVLQRRLL